MGAFSFPEVFSRARLKTQEAATLLGVTRVTVSSYKNGGTPHSLMQRRVRRFTEAVRLAVEAGDLPLHPDIPRSDRAGLLRSILSKHMPDK